MLPVNARQNLTAVFHIDFKSDVDNKVYQGSFTTKKMSISDTSKLRVLKTQLNGGMHYDESKPGFGVDETTDFIHEMMATLTVCLTAAPDWWNLDEISDHTLLQQVYSEVMNHERTFRGGATDSRDVSQGSQARSDRAGGQPDNAGAVSQVVDSEVQASLEP